jgi:CheY-like chemotaxis protein
MSAILTRDRLPSELGDSDAYNRLQMRRAVLTRGDPTAETPLGVTGESLRVLVVDDHPATADTMSMLVGVWGHDVRRAYDGTSALALANAYQPDVLLLDINMTNMNGLELAGQVRQQARFKGCFVVAVTGCTDSRLWPLCEEAGVDLILIKPVSPSILRALLLWESEYVLQSRQDAAMHGEPLTTIEPETKSIPHRPPQLSCLGLQGTVAS